MVRLTRPAAPAAKVAPIATERPTCTISEKPTRGWLNSHRSITSVIVPSAMSSIPVTPIRAIRRVSTTFPRSTRSSSSAISDALPQLA